MARIRLTFESLTLFQDEEAGDTHMAVYATVTDTAGNQLAAFRWNNHSQKVDEVRSYSLQVDTTNSPVVDFDLDSVATITVNACTDDDNPWPDADGHRRPDRRRDRRRARAHGHHGPNPVPQHPGKPR